MKCNVITLLVVALSFLCSPPLFASEQVAAETAEGEQEVTSETETETGEPTVTDETDTKKENGEEKEKTGTEEEEPDCE